MNLSQSVFSRASLIYLRESVQSVAENCRMFQFVRHRFEDKKRSRPHPSIAYWLPHYSYRNSIKILGLKFPGKGK